MNITNLTHLKSLKDRLRTNPTSLTPKLQLGVTLVEVLIAMFVFAVDVLALLAVQLHTVSNVREPENQTAVTRITQSLTEGMFIDPAPSEETDTAGDRTSHHEKFYDAHITPSSEQLRDSKQTNEFEEKMTKAQPAQTQITQFKADLTRTPSKAQVLSTICRGSSGVEPIYGKGFNIKYDDKSGVIIVKVLRLQNIEGGNSVKNFNTLGHHAVHTCQPHIRD